MRFISSWLLIISLPLCLQAQLPTAELIDEYNKSELQVLANSLGVIPNIIEYNYDVRVYKVIYETTDAHGQPTQASGAMIVPVESNCDLALGSYQHGTAVHKDNVPSRLSGEVNVGLLYATNGIVQCMPDYLGLGDSPGLHPYVHARSEATTVVDMLRSARLLSADLGYRLNDQLFLFGYSQGGHATAAAHRMIEEELSGEFTVTASAPMSGPYDVSGVQAEVITSDQSYPTPNYLPYILFAYQSIYGNLYSDPSEVLLPPYDTLLPPLFDGTYSGNEIDALMPDIPNQIMVPAVLDSFRNDPDHRFRVALRDNDVYDWKPEAPTKLIYCRDDDQVSYRNSLVAYDQFIANGAGNVEIQDIGGGLDHNGCAPFAFISGLVYFKRFLKVRNGIEITGVDITGSSGNNGSILIDATGGNGGLQYNWNTMVASDSIGGLAAGDYTVSVSDENGCFIQQTYTVEQLTGFTTISPESAFKLYPNPTASAFTVEWENGSKEARLLIRNGAGKLFYSKSFDASFSAKVDLSLNPGIYLVELRQQKSTLIKKVVIIP